MTPVDNFDNMGIMLRKTPGRGEDVGRAGEQGEQEKEMADGNDRGKDEDGQEKNKEERTGKEECNNQQTPQVAAILTDRAKSELNRTEQPSQAIKSGNRIKATLGSNVVYRIPRAMYQPTLTHNPQTMISPRYVPAAAHT